MTDAGMSVAHANAILAEVEPLQGDLLCMTLICGMWFIYRVRRAGITFPVSCVFFIATLLSFVCGLQRTHLACMSQTI